MKFTIATFHNAYDLFYIPDGKIIELELIEKKSPVTLADINWLKPIENHKYIADMIFENEIIGLDNVETALCSYFKDQFYNDKSRLLWMPTFHKKHYFCQHYLDNISVFNVGNTIFSKVISTIATEVEVLVFYLGNKSLVKLGSKVLKKETFSIGNLKICISPHEVSDKSRVYEDIRKNYNLTVLKQNQYSEINGLGINDPVLLDQFSNFGKLDHK